MCARAVYREAPLGRAGGNFKYLMMSLSLSLSYKDSQICIKGGMHRPKVAQQQHEREKKKKMRGKKKGPPFYSFKDSGLLLWFIARQQ